MARLWKAGGEVVVALRQWSVALSAEKADSSLSSQEMRTRSLLVGTAGECFTALMIGAMFAVRASLAAPGVPPMVWEMLHAWPLSLLSAGLRSSMLRPPPSASVLQSQPPQVASRMRVAQSPSL